MTVDFSHGYQPPGVYIEEDTTPLVASTGVPPTVVAIVGPSAGHQTNTEQIALSTTAIRLVHQGIDTDSVVVKTVADGQVLDSSEYTLTTVPASPTDQAYYVDFERSGGATVAADSPIFVSYEFTNPSFFDPKTFSNYEDVKDSYGQPVNLVAQQAGDTNYQAVLSPLSLAAKIAFENGAGQVLLVATEPATTSSGRRTNLKAALDKIATDWSVNVIVPLTDGIASGESVGTGQDIRAHVETASNDGHLRIAVVGFDPNVITAPDTAVSSWGSKRVMQAYANDGGMQFYNGGTNQTVTVGHQYLAAAYAGRMAALPVQKSLTREVLRSFTGIAGTPLTNALKNQYAAAGVALSEVNRFGQLVVRHGVTTDPTNVNTREAAVVRARDALVTMVQTGTETAGLIGDPIDVNTPLSVKSVVAGLLEYAKTSGVVVDYTDLKVRQRSTEPSVIEVKFAYKPAYPLNYIVISFSINVATGENDLSAAVA